MSVGDVAMSGVMSIKSQITEDLEILEVGEGLVRKGRLNHVLDKSKTTLRVKLPDGTEQSEPTEDNGALHGRVEAIELISGQWKRTLEGRRRRLSRPACWPVRRSTTRCIRRRSRSASRGPRPARSCGGGSAATCCPRGAR
ncbi:hypothetical protein [Nannocystis pusilla]|uniref:hypothetical protein n=1 Tax=Nannocystis pusilla TaxID=889268 RepID=UPI003B7BD8E1